MLQNVMFQARISEIFENAPEPTRKKSTLWTPDSASTCPSRSLYGLNVALNSI